MVIGSYKMTNFKLEEIPPGIVDHKEWTPDNGRNNALRINGLGAPRAFYTPVLREYKIPNVSYGEDYAVGLLISRNYQIGRIYEPIYILCAIYTLKTDLKSAMAKNKCLLFWKLLLCGIGSCIWLFINHKILKQVQYKRNTAGDVGLLFH